MDVMTAAGPAHIQSGNTSDHPSGDARIAKEGHQLRLNPTEGVQ
jgi:hypothetical protein